MLREWRVGEINESGLLIELNFSGFPLSVRAIIFIIHSLVLLHAVYRLIYIKINEINK